MADHEDVNQLHWYVAHTYSGYENKVKANLEKAVENNNMQDLITEIRVPVEEVVEVKNGKRRTVQRKVFPGYVLVRMIMTDESWYLVRNTRGVTGFVGPGSRPIPLTDDEVETMGMECRTMRVDIAIGETVRILTGPLEDFIGRVEKIDTLRQTIRVKVMMFGRETPVELEFSQVKRENK
jgi:transcriptional antiterminator NusG